MPLFVETRSGEAVRIDPAENRQKPHLEERTLRLWRARTCSIYQKMGFSIEQIGWILNRCKRTVILDLEWLAAERASGRDHTPLDPPDDLLDD